MSDSFNLIDQPWIKTDAGEVSLKALFAGNGSCCKSLAGTPVEKISALKLALALAHSALRGRLKNNADWQALSCTEISASVQDYLKLHYDKFDLYGTHPFLQFPQIRNHRHEAPKSPGTYLTEISTGNTTVLTQFQIEKPLSDSEKARLIVSLMSFALSGKQTDHTIVLSKNYEKGKSACSGPSVGMYGALHCFYKGEYFLETLRYNLLTEEDLKALNLYPQGIGVAPWESMPQGENDETAQALKHSYMGRLVSLCRFCLLDGSNIFVTEGIKPLTVKDKVFDPSVTPVQIKNGELSLLYCDPDKRPWRQCTAFLSFLDPDRREGCRQLALPFGRIHSEHKALRIWAGGIKVTFQSGEQYVSGKDDYVESEIMLPEGFTGSLDFAELSRQMTVLDGISRALFASIRDFYDKQKSRPGKSLAPSRQKEASREFWLKCERYADELTECVCTDSAESKKRLWELINTFVTTAEEIFDQNCPQTTARQITTWAECRPHLNKFRQKKSDNA